MLTGAAAARAAATPRRWLPAGSLRARLAGGALWSALGSGLSRATTLAAMVAIARLLGPTRFGELGLVQSTVAVFGVYAGLGLNLAATRYLAEYRRGDPERAGRVLALAERAALGSGGGCALAVALAAPALASRVMHAPGLAGAVAIGAALVLFGALNGVQTGALAGLEAFRALARVNVISAAGALALPLAGVWLLGLPGAVLGLAAALGASCLLAGAALRAELRRAGIRVAGAGCWQERAVLWRFALPAVLGSSLVVPATWIGDLVLVNRYPRGYAELGAFNAADQWRVALLFLPGVLAPVTVAIFASLGLAGHPRRGRIVALAVAAGGAAAGVPALLVVAGGSRIMGLYGSGYQGHRAVLAALALAAVVTALAAVLGQVVVSSLSMWWNLALNALWAAAFLLSCALLVPRAGALGLASAFLIASLVQLFASGVYVVRALRPGAARAAMPTATEAP